jgi:CHASE2 domain-containing sensor protein
MGKDSTSPKTKQNASTVNQLHKAPTTLTVTARQSSQLNRLGHILMGGCALVAALATGGNLRLVQLLESQTQSLFFELRGPVEPPDNIVIVAIDDPSLSAAKEFYDTDPLKYAYLEPLIKWPWKRTAYAQVIERLMAAGARSVAVDVLFADPSSYGTTDDEQLADVLQRYAGRVTLAAEYVEVEIPQGSLLQLTQPERLFWTEPKSIGSVNFPLEPDGKVHRFASEFPQLLAEKYQDQVEQLDVLKVALPSFEQAAVVAAQRSFPQSKGEYIYFYGPSGTFEQISFWDVLDPVNWNTYLKQGKGFKDKIVLIGGTASSLHDFHAAPFSKSWLYLQPMSGVEIQANAIATLLEGRAIAQAIPNDSARGLFVLLLVAGTGILLAKPKRALTGFIYPLGIAVAWTSISYLSFVHGLLILPTAAPVVAIALGGVSYLATAAASERLKKLHLRRTLQRYASSPVVQEIISQQDDLQDLLYQRELAIVDKIIGGRYKIVKVLGSGGFSETYIAEDNQRPGKPLCVVKQLRLANHNPKHLQLARRLFNLEAETLEKLGKHNQIPQLFAYFEEDEEFYLVQELIVGHPLSQELHPGKLIPEPAVIHILHDLLQTLEFVHSHDVIHRDIKPSNIMRRHSDDKLVLIDFGAVKEVTTQLLDHEGQTDFTIGIGTQGYAPNEQCAGRVRFSSDIYALGMIGIKALTGLSPHELQQDSKTGELLWIHKAQISFELAAILNQMVRYDFTQRYQSVSEVRVALEELINSSTASFVLDYSSTSNLSPDDIDTPTAPWIPLTTEIPESSSSTVPLPPSN